MPSAQCECIVTGSLSVVLRMSRAMGVAPLTFNKVRDGWSVCVSQGAYFVGLIILLSTSVLSIFSVTDNMGMNPKSSFPIESYSAHVIQVVSESILVMVICVAAFTGMKRMKSLIQCLAQLQKINLKLNLYHQEQKSGKIRNLIVTGLMTLSLFNTFTELAMYYHHAVVEAIENRDIAITRYMYVFCFILAIILELLQMQFFLTALLVLDSFKLLNKCLRNILQELNIASDTKQSNDLITKQNRGNLFNRKVFNIDSSVISTITVCPGRTISSQKSVQVSHLSSLYGCLCELVGEVNESHGPLLVALLLHQHILLTTTMYHAITHMINNQDADFLTSALLQLFWVVLHFNNVLIIVEPCHQTHVEMELTKNIVSQMTQVLPLKEDSLGFELEIFLRQLMLNQVFYSPMELITLNRTLIATIMGSTTTYLVVILKYR